MEGLDFTALIRPALIIFFTSLFMRLLVNQVVAGSRENRTEEALRGNLTLSHPAALRWLGITCLSFFTLFLLLAAQANFAKPSQRWWAIAGFLPFIALGAYLTVESFTRIGLSEGTRLWRSSWLRGTKSFAADAIRRYSFSSGLQYHYFHFEDGSKLSFSALMIGTKELLEWFGRTHTGLIRQQLVRETSVPLRADLLCLLGSSGDPGFQVMFTRWMASEDEEPEVRRAAVMALLINIEKARVCNVRDSIRENPNLRDLLPAIDKVLEQVKEKKEAA